MHEISFNIPFTHPMLIYGIVLLIILVLPMILRPLKIPGIVGLIIFGMLIGPNGLNIIVADSGIIFFGQLGILFLMLIAGLELDFHKFRQHRSFNLTYGILLFLLPVLLGFIILQLFFGLEAVPTLLIAIIFSTNTLVSYPIVKRLNIESTEPVIAAVSAAVIADTSILILLGFLKQIALQGTDIMVALNVILKFAIYAFIILYLFPKLCKYYFKFIDIENTSQFLFVFLLMVFTAVLSIALDIEPIVGAFLLGLALNRLIPNHSLLMSRIEFVGNALFIPFFLVYVGFLIDLKALFSDIGAWTYSLLFLAIIFTGKYLAVTITSKIFKLDKESKNLMFGLNLSQAGATIAIAIVVHRLGYLDVNGLNAIIIIVLVTCIVSSFITEKFGRLIAVKNTEIKEVPDVLPQRILVPYTNPNTVESLIHLAILFKEHNSEPLFPLTVINYDENTNKTLYNNKLLVDRIAKQAESRNIAISSNVRIDTVVPEGITKAINELMITATIIGWNYKKIDNFIHNKMIQQLLSLSDSMIVICRVMTLQNIKNLNLFIPENAEFEKGFVKWVKFITTFAKNLNTMVNVYNKSKSNYPIAQLKAAGIKNINTYEVKFNNIDFEELINTNSVNIAVRSRIKGISYNHRDTVFINRFISYEKEGNMILLYPEQNEAFNPEDIYSEGDIMSESLISANLNVFDKIKNTVKGLFASKNN